MGRTMSKHEGKRSEAAESAFLRMLVDVYLRDGIAPAGQVQSSTTLPLEPPSMAANPAR